MNWDTVGFDSNKIYFENAVKNGILSHAYLFWGPEMIGKKTFARDLYRLINGRDVIIDGDPDFKVLSPNLDKDETKIYIEDARDIRSFLSFKPYQGPYKYVLIDNADRLTAEASNSILKILEEPPSFSIIVLVTSKPKYLLPTILSRCSSIRFLPLKSEAMAPFIRNKKLNKEDGDFLLKVANGRLGWVINTLSSGDLNKIRKSLTDIEGVSKQGVFEKIQFAKKIYEKGDYPELISNWINFLHADLITSNQNQKLIKDLLSLHTLLSQPQFNHRLAIENFLINQN